jgi:basic membrane protein A
VKRKRSISIIAASAALALVLAACGSSSNKSESKSGATTPPTTAAGGTAKAVTLDDLCKEAKAKNVTVPAGFNVRLVTDVGKIDDGTFNQYSYDAMVAAGKCFGFPTSYIETASEADYAANLATTLAAKPTVMITNGFLLGTDTLKAAQANPTVKIIGIDQFQTEYPANYIGVLFREDQGGYLAGTMAALLSKSGVIGVVGGRQDVPPVVKFVNAYKNGANALPFVRTIKPPKTKTDTMTGNSQNRLRMQR